MADHNNTGKPGAALIKNHLKRAFQDKASEDLPDDLMSLIKQLRDQDDKNGK